MNFIHHTAIIYHNVELGEGNHIGPYCIIGSPPEHRNYFDAGFGKVIIGNNNVLTGAATIDAGTDSDTIIGNDCFIMKRVHIGHDAKISDNVTISPNTVIGGHVVVMEGATIGMNVSTHQYVIIGAYSMLGMGSIVPKGKKIEPFQTYAGNPVKWLSENKKTIHLLNLKFLEDYNKLL